MSADYARLTRRCKTQNQFNSVHIELERRITPLEFHAVAEAAQAGRLPDTAKVWTDRWLDFMPTLGTAPEPYLATDVAEYLTWLRQRRVPGQRRRTLVAFCDAVDRMMLPLPVFLQVPPAADWNILKVKRPIHLTTGDKATTAENLADAARALFRGSRHRSYMRPGRELRELNRVFAAVRSALGDTPPEDVTCIGCSAGASIALLAALRLGAHRCILVGGHLPDKLVPLLPALTAPNPPARTDIIYLIGGAFRRDHNHAERLRQEFGGRRAGIAGLSAHNVLLKLQERGELIATLNALLDGRPLPVGMLVDAGR